MDWQQPSKVLFNLLNYSVHDLDMNQTGPSSSLITVCVSHWENSSVDFGLSTVYAHLGMTNTHVLCEI